MTELAGKMIESIIHEKAKGNPMLINLIKAKLILKGMHPCMLANRSMNDPSILTKLEAILKDIR